jgi:hypothetical protein
MVNSWYDNVHLLEIKVNKFDQFALSESILEIYTNDLFVLLRL